jgi:hypothetical protein
MGPGKHDVPHHPLELRRLFEQGSVVGRLEHGHLLAGRLRSGEPLLGELGAAAGLVASLNEVHRHLESGDLFAEVGLLQLRVEGGERVEEGAEIVDLLEQRVLLDE